MVAPPSVLRPPRGKMAGMSDGRQILPYEARRPKPRQEIPWWLIGLLILVGVLLAGSIIFPNIPL